MRFTEAWYQLSEEEQNAQMAKVVEALKASGLSDEDIAKVSVESPRLSQEEQAMVDVIASTLNQFT